MADQVKFYKDKFGRDFRSKKGRGLPLISTQLDSVRAYEFEVHFLGLPPGVSLDEEALVLGAKQVGQVGFQVEDIIADRVNDRVFYPGKASPEELTITFDNLYLRETASDLWKWFRTAAYDPLTGELSKVGAPGGENQSAKALKVEIVQLDNTLEPHAVAEMYGVYPKAWRLAEMNYSTNDFNTVEVTFRYDFMDYYNL